MSANDLTLYNLTQHGPTVQGLLDKLAALPTNESLTVALNNKQDTLSFDDEPTENSTNPVKSGGVYDAIAELKEIVAGLETVAEGYVRVAGSSSPALSYKSYKFSELGGFGHESAFSVFYPALVGTPLTGTDTIGKVLHVLQKLNWYKDIYSNDRLIDGSEGDVVITNIEPIYAIMGKHTINSVTYDVFLVSLSAFTWQGITAEKIEKYGQSPDYCVRHTDTDNVVRMHSVYNENWDGSYTAPVGVVGKYVYSQDAETGDITETYDEDETLLGGAGGCHTTDLSLPNGEQAAMNNNSDTTATVPFMNNTAFLEEVFFAMMLAEGGTFDVHNASLFGSGFSTNDGATAATYWDESNESARNGMRYVDKNGDYAYKNFGYLTSGSAAAFGLSIDSVVRMINSWRNPFKIMEAQRAMIYAMQNGVGELEWFVYDGNKYKYRSVDGFSGPSDGEMTCVVWKMISTKFGSAAVDPSDGTTSLEGNRVDFLVSVGLYHGRTTQVSPSWWTSGLLFTEDEEGNYECYMERDQAELIKTPTTEILDTTSAWDFESAYVHVGDTIAKGEGYAKDYHNDCLMLPASNSDKTGGALHTYVGKYNWFTGSVAAEGKKVLRGFRRGDGAYFAILSPLSVGANYSPSSTNPLFGFGTCVQVVE